jgi:hypothetical protein
MHTRTTAVRLHPAYDDPAAVRALIEGAGPFWPLARYAASEAERAAVGGDAVGGEGGHHTFVPPWFRQDVAVLGSALVPGAELILHNPHFVAAAHAVYGDEAVVRPTTVYVNVMGATPFPFVPHLDIPAFRGMTREHHPLWLLKQMQASGLFEDWRVHLATAVSWFWDGPGGAFHYWPDGPEGRHEVEEPPFDNVAIVADNEATFHGVGPVGPDDDPMPMGLTLAAELRRDGDGWAVVDGGEVRRRYGLEAMRITVSWKADVFADERAAAVADEHRDDLNLGRVIDTFVTDLRARGIGVAVPDDPHHDEAWVATLADAYRSGIPRIVHA